MSSAVFVTVLIRFISWYHSKTEKTVYRKSRASQKINGETLCNQCRKFKMKKDYLILNINKLRKMGENNVLWITPFKKQCFVILGVSWAMGQLGLVFGFSSGLLPQLKRPDSLIPIDDSQGSWIASIPAMSIMVGNLTFSYLMDRFGRRIAYLAALILSTASWIGIAVSTNVVILLCARCLQGVTIGAVLIICPLLIGEYSSPVNRGAFLMTIAIVIGFANVFIHSMGSYLNWKTTAFVCIAITVVNLLFAILSPESPSWLSSQGRFEECKKAFRWLRGDNEEEELNKMIEASLTVQQGGQKDNNFTESFTMKAAKSIRSLRQTFRMKEFFKPLIIMIHIYSLAHWSGVNFVASYAVDFIHSIVGGNVEIPMILLSLDIQRIISNTIALMVIKKIKRRTMIFMTIGLNIATLFGVAAFTYARHISLMLTCGDICYYCGIGLVHFLIFTISVGALPISFILAGEIIPLQYKSLAGGISSLFFSIHLFANVKSIPILLNSIGAYGLFMLYGCLLVYFLAVVGVILPETKDKTLLDIEEEFKGIQRHKSPKNLTEL